MSSRSSYKKASKGKESSRTSSSASPTLSFYPTQWTEWAWNAQQKEWQRYRLKAPEEYEYDTSAAQSPQQAAPSQPSHPRTVATHQSLPSIEETATGPYVSTSNYTTSSGAAGISGLAEGLARTSLNPTPTGTSYTSSSYGTTIVQGGHPKGLVITTRDPSTNRETADRNYKVQPAWKFEWGKVFKVLWTEPSGGGDGSDNASWTEQDREGNHKKKLFQKVRRFVVIKPKAGHCICLPINTYAQQGVLKRGVHAGDHTIIYTGDNPIIALGERERGLIKTPIRMEPFGPRHKLDNFSRLNYAKVYTVEYNVKVWFIGQIATDSHWHLSTDYDEVNPPLGPKGMPPLAHSGPTATYGNATNLSTSAPALSSSTFKIPLSGYSSMLASTYPVPSHNASGTTAASPNAAPSGHHTSTATPPPYPGSSTTPMGSSHKSSGEYFPSSYGSPPKFSEDQSSRGPFGSLDHGSHGEPAGSYHRGSAVGSAPAQSASSRTSSSIEPQRESRPSGEHYRVTENIYDDESDDDEHHRRRRRGRG